MTGALDVESAGPATIGARRDEREGTLRENSTNEVACLLSHPLGARASDRRLAGQKVDDEARAPVMKGRNIFGEKLNHRFDEDVRRREAVLGDLLVEVEQRCYAVDDIFRG